MCLLFAIICRWDASVRNGNCSCAVSMMFDMSNTDSGWDQEAARLNCFFVRPHREGIQFDNFSREGHVLSVGYLCVCGASVWSLCKPTWLSGSKDWSHSCFPPTSAKQYPAVCDQCRKWRKKSCRPEWWKLPGSLGFNLSFFFLKHVGRQRWSECMRVTAVCLGLVNLAWQVRAPGTVSKIVVWAREHAWRRNDSNP